MSVKSALDNIQHSVEDNISSVLATGRTTFSNIVGSATTSLTNIYSGGFTGMSETGLAELKQAIDSYCNDIEEIISSFNQEGDISSAFRGNIKDAAYDFIETVKELLQAYVSTTRQELKELDEAYQNFLAADKSVSVDVLNDASDIRSNANSIRLD